MPTASTIQILVNGAIDITRFVLFAKTTFQQVALATPGQARIVCKDPLKELDFTTGDEVALIVDGTRLWGGIIFTIGQGHFFPVVDTTDLDAVHDLQWVLDCTDYNILMDKRVIRDPSNYLKVPEVGPGRFGQVLREIIPLYMDVPPDFNYTTYVDDTEYIWASPEGGKAPMMQQGTKWKQQLDEVTQAAGYEWWVDPYKRLHVHAFEVLQAPWGFVDRNPDGVNAIGFREGSVREDGSQMVTDALVWGGRVITLDSAPENQHPVFARYPDPPANTETRVGVTMPAFREEAAIERIDTYGRWQRAELRFNNPLYDSQDAVKLRAYSIVAGPGSGTRSDGVDMGLNRPVWQISLAWFAHQVPGQQHLVPGMFVPMVFWTMGTDSTHPLTILLPLRSVTISFPTIPSDLPDDEPLTYVRYDGEFGISYSDSRYMWRLLLSDSGTPESILASVGQESDSVIAGAYGAFFTEESPDGARVQFTLPHSYLAGTTEVYLNGLLQRPRYEYLETSPSLGIITFIVAPFADDTLWVRCRTGAS